MSGGGDDALTLIYLAGCLILVASGLAVRRIPIGQGLRMALAWVLIFAAGFAIFALRDDFAALGRRLLNESSGVVVTDAEVRIRKREDGHFWVDAKINGQDVEFLIDSGATVTTVSADVAAKTGLERHGLSPVVVETANGPADAWRSRARSLEVAGIERSDFAVHIAGDRNRTNLLGMNFLSTLSSWRVEGQWLVLVP